MKREEQLRMEIDLIKAVTAEFEAAAAGDPLIFSSLAPSNARAREEVLQLLGVNYVGPESLGRLLYGNEKKFSPVDLDYVKLKDILTGIDELNPTKRRFETYALVFRPPISLLKLMVRANAAAEAAGKSPAFMDDKSYNFEIFATVASKAGEWELIRTETVPGSTSKHYNDQKELIANRPEQIPASLSALASLLVGQYLEHDIRLYNGEWHYGRTSTCSDSGDPVCIGGMDAEGAQMDEDKDEHAVIGLAVSWSLK